MKNRDFDDALREFVQSSTLPYDASQWDKMAFRLDAHAVQKPLVAGRAMPLYRWVSGAVAACLTVAAALYLSREPHSGLAIQTGSVADRPVVERPVGSKPTSPHSIAPEARQELQKQAPVRTLAHRITQRPSPERPAANSTEPGSALPAAKADTATVAASALPETTHPQLKPERPFLGSRPPEDDDLPRKRRMAFGVNGGYNIGSSTNNFTVGVTVKQQLNSRLHVETGIALVSGGFESRRDGITPNQEMVGLADRQTETSTSRLMYLQAAPTLNYTLFGGLSAGGGVDAQRLLGEGADLGQVKSLAGEPGVPQPEWDFGLTARMDVRVARKLRAGMMYRESIRSISKGSEAAKRNYLLLQLSYTIF